MPFFRHPEYTNISIPVLSLICIALILTSGCARPASASARASLPPTVIPDNPPPATAPPATVEIMTLAAVCQINDSVFIEGTVRSTASRVVNIVVRGSTYDSAGIKLGSGSDFISIDPDGTSTFTIIVPDGCGLWEWKYNAWIDEVL